MDDFFRHTLPRALLTPLLCSGLALGFGVVKAQPSTQPTASHTSAQHRGAEGDNHVPAVAAPNETPPPPNEDATTVALRRALIRRLTVWQASPSSRAVFVNHCRRARGGCRQRITLFANLIAAASNRHGIDPFLLAAVALRESGLDPQAAGTAGERGIVQLHPRGAGARTRFVRSDRYRQRCLRQVDACQTEVVEVGAELLSRNIERCGGVREGLGAYNRGECGTTDYSRRVMRERRRLLSLAKELRADERVTTPASPT